jgi:hypothetical protein
MQIVGATIPLNPVEKCASPIFSKFSWNVSFLSTILAKPEALVMNTGRDIEQETSVVPLEQAVFCANCETVSNSSHDACQVCGSHSLVSLLRMLGGTLRGNNGQPEELLKYNLVLTVKVNEVSAADLNRSIEALTRLAQVGKDIEALHIKVETVLAARGVRKFAA